MKPPKKKDLGILKRSTENLPPGNGLVVSQIEQAPRRRIEPQSLRAVPTDPRLRIQVSEAQPPINDDMNIKLD